jgi:uncharacterized protein YbjT (DUF2867 family)
MLPAAPGMCAKAGGERVKITEVCVLGGSGFVGRHICHQLAAAGYRVRVPTRNRERAKSLILLPTVDVFTADIHDAADLRYALHGADAVVNLVGVLHGGRRQKSFREAHEGLTRKVIGACRESGTTRMLHMSALNADVNAPSEYLRTKGEAEKLVRASGLAATVFRPSVIFGREDRFLNLFAQMLQYVKAVPLGSPNARFQPIYVEDVAKAFVLSLADPAAVGHAYNLCGPRVYTLRQLVEYVGRETGQRRPVLGLGDRLSYLQAWMMEFSPIKILSRDNYLSMKIDSVCTDTLPFGMVPTPLEAVASQWLAARTPRGRYARFRDEAGRSST